MIFKRKNKLRELIDENARLRARHVEQSLLNNATDAAMREFVNAEIGRWNADIRATNGPRSGESADSYRARLVDANKAAV